MKDGGLIGPGLIRHRDCSLTLRVAKNGLDVVLLVQDEVGPTEYRVVPHPQLPGRLAVLGPTHPGRLRSPGAEAARRQLE